MKKTINITSGRSRGLVFSSENTENFFPALTTHGRHMLLVTAGTFFHVAIFAAPITGRAHGILLDLAWGVLPPRIDPAVTGIFTIMAIVSGLVLVIRRTFVRNVRAVSSWLDYAAMTCVLAPFVSGLLARKIVGHYETVMVFHCASAHVLLLAMGWTRLGHMVFFMSGRFITSRMFKGVSA